MNQVLRKLTSIWRIGAYLTLDVCATEEEIVTYLIQCRIIV